MFQIKIERLTTLIFHSKRVYKNATKKLSKMKNRVEQRKEKLLKKNPHDSFSLFNTFVMSFFQNKS